MTIINNLQNTDGWNISAIIPTHNRANWLVGAIESVLRQSHPVAELIVVDDGSTDNTKEVVQKYANVRYIYQSQRGPSAARNAGARMASGDWLAFLDSDDRWMQEKIAHQIAFLQAHSDMHAVYTDEIWIRNGRRVNQGKRHRKAGGWIFEMCIPLCIISPSSILLSRKLWQQSGGFDESLPACEDYDLWLRIAAKHPIGFIEMPLIEKNGGHSDQLSQQWGLDRYRVAALEKILSDELPPKWRLLAIKQVLHQCKVLMLGFEKREKQDETIRFRKKYQHWQSVLQVASNA